MCNKPLYRSLQQHTFISQWQVCGKAVSMLILMGLAEIYSKLFVGLRSDPVIFHWLLRIICIMLNGMAEVQEAKQSRRKYLKPLLNTSLLYHIAQNKSVPEPETMA